MKRITEKVICGDCPKLKTAFVEEGQKFGVEYVVVKPKERYLVCDNEEVEWNDIMKELKDFRLLYVPMFGKCEIEEFIAFALQESLIITKDLTNLFNMELLHDDFPYNMTRVSSETIRERLLPYFDVVKNERDTTYLRFKWEKIQY